MLANKCADYIGAVYGNCDMEQVQAIYQSAGDWIFCAADCGGQDAEAAALELCASDEGGLSVCVLAVSGNPNSTIWPSRGSAFLIEISLPETIIRSEQLKTNLEPKKPGRPRQHEDGAARVAAFRARNAYPGHRHDIYLSEDAHVIVSRLKKKSGLSASAVIDAVLCGEIKLPVTK